VVLVARSDEEQQAMKPVAAIILIGIVAAMLYVFVEGPRRAHAKCLARGGEVTIGRDMLCFDKEGRYVR
jgi:peptidoglycan/LPS O-acetylase OafA/YrhL